MPDDPTPPRLTPAELRELARRAREWAAWYNGEREADRQMAEVRRVISSLPKATARWLDCQKNKSC
jgi:hypothetical protein